MRGVAFLRCGTISAVVGCAPPFENNASAGLWHDRVVGRALRTCSAVVPFRLGVDLGSQAEIVHLLSLNEVELSAALGRFRGCVEMGLKIRIGPGLDASANDGFLRLPPRVDGVRALAPHSADRREWLSRAPRGTTFDGCYLILRRAIAQFWRAVDDIRQADPEVPLLGSGPWAPYSFCDVPLRNRAPEGRAQVTQ